MAAQYLIEKHEVDFPSLSPVSMGFLHILQKVVGVFQSMLITQ